MNVRGFGVKSKFGWVKGMCFNERPNVAAFQETKCKNLSFNWVCSLWGNCDFDFIQKDAIGNSGGLLFVWDTTSFVVESALVSDFFVAIRGKWCGSRHETVVANVYGPHTDSKKWEMWNTLDNVLQNIDSAWVICGDFNEVREQSDRLNCVFIQARADRFNNFIVSNSLIDIPINGKKFTRISDDGTKFSKLDRFLVNDNFIKLWKDLSVVALDRRESDHCPLVLRDKVIDFGPKLFKVFDEWLNKDDAIRIINEAWVKPIIGSRKDCMFRDRLKNVKNDLRKWSKSEFGSLDV
ncbi:uncharacterized protein [Rutidosis leptorrhynchoides]|uniref:uncharacterized protein n=1 Tax=Rutidosis leptorrhynchoides TaxID=125765 RepID=UPI003A9A0FCA